MQRDEKTWIILQSGSRHWPLAPSPEDFTIEDIAHGLAQTARYGGQAPRFYSVAEHSFHVSVWAGSHAPRGAWRTVALMGLLHDASEGLGLGDMVRPVKRAMPEYRVAEDRLMACVWEKFGVREADQALHQSLIKSVDNAMLSAERAQLFRHVPPEFFSDADPLPQAVAGLDWEAAKGMFLRRYRDVVASPDEPRVSFESGTPPW